MPLKFSILKAIKSALIKIFDFVAKGNKERLFYLRKKANKIKELQNFVKQDVAPYKYPRAIEFVEDLPKTNSGKIRRIELREAEKEKYL